MNSKYDNFLTDIANKAKFEDKIINLYKSEYEELFEFILTKKDNEFMNTLSLNIRSLLEDEYSLSIFENKYLLSLLKKCDREFYENVFKKDKIILVNALKKRLPGEVLKYSFRKHCNYQESEIIHHCPCESYLEEDENENLDNEYEDNYCDKFIKIEQKNKTYLICKNCTLCYMASCVKLYCTFCSVEYYTTLDIDNTSNINNDVQPATWEKYHCNIIYNDQMPCIQCKNGKLLYDIKQNLVFCKNQSCKFVSDPRNILWRCVVCNKEFVSNAKIYNPLEYKMVKKTVKDALIKKDLAFPSIFPCRCKKPEYMIHKEGCDGKLYKGKLYDREMIICSKCHTMTFAEKFIWICQKCNKRFRDGGDDGRTSIKNYGFNNLNKMNEEDNLNLFNQSTNESDCNKTISCNSSILFNELISNTNNNAIYSSSSPGRSNDEIPEFSLDNYDIISQIGEGARCKVYAAKENEGYNFFALKRSICLSYPKEQIKILKLQNAFASKNQNIAIIKGIYYDEKSKELNVLEELALSDLEKEIFSLKKTKTFYKEKAIINLLTQIVSACSFLQQQGFVHWNISPSNILIFKGKRYKLSNFSRARKIQDVSSSTLAKKDNYFTDPILNERLALSNSNTKDIKHIDLVRCDVFSLALTILYLITLNMQTVIDVHNVWNSRKNIFEANEKIAESLRTTFNSFLPDGGEKLKDILIQMMNFNLRKRLDFASLSKYMNDVVIEEC